MKKFYFLYYILFFIISSNLAAQSLTQANFVHAGDSTHIIILNNNSLTLASAGGSGSGQLWDFSSFTEDTSIIVPYVSPSLTPYASYFPSANITEAAGGNSYEYAKINDSADFILGDAYTTTINGKPVTVIEEYNDTAYKFPLDYNTWQVYTLNGTSTTIASNGDTIGISYYTHIDSTIIDATGTLITPDGDTVINVLRLKQIEDWRGNIDNSSELGKPAGTIYQESKSRTVGYTFYCENKLAPSISLGFTMTNSSPSSKPDTTRSITYVPIDKIGITGNYISSSFTAATVYPNPSQGVITINPGQAFSYQITILNNVGQQIYTQAAVGSTTINIPNLTLGIYYMQLVSAQGNATHKLVIQQ